MSPARLAGVIQLAEATEAPCATCGRLTGAPDYGFPRLCTPCFDESEEARDVLE